MNTRHFIFLAITVVLIFWITFWVLPGKNVITLEKIGMNEAYSGPVYGLWSSSIKGKIISPECIRPDEWRKITTQHSGWDAVIAWWPFALLIAVASSTCGWFMGCWSRDHDAEKETEKRINAMKYDIEQSKTMMTNARKIKEDAEQASERAYNWVKSVEKKAAQEVGVANYRMTEAERIRDDAERKLAKEREDHREELAKAKARISKEKGRREKNID